jgi:chaperonin cofactor prefoldin
MTPSDAIDQAEKYRKERNRLLVRVRHLERRQKCDRKRIGELKTMLSENGIDWRNYKR